MVGLPEVQVDMTSSGCPHDEGVETSNTPVIWPIFLYNFVQKGLEIV
jgi:hypothetical protein